MARLLGMFQRGTVWWLRVMIPKDLRPAYRGRSKVVRSLHTSDRREAALRGSMGRHALLHEFQLVRGGGPLPSTPAAERALPLAALLPAPQQETSPAPVASPTHTLRQVYAQWSAASDGGTDAKQACARALAMFEEWAGPSAPPVKGLTRAQGHEFKGWLLAKARAGDYSSKTIHGFMTSVCSLLRFAHQELEWTARHTWRGITIDYETENPRARWSAHHFDTMAALPLFQRMELPRAWRAGAEAAYWLPFCWRSTREPRCPSWPN